MFSARRHYFFAGLHFSCDPGCPRSRSWASLPRTQAGSDHHSPVSADPFNVELQPQVQWVAQWTRDVPDIRLDLCMSFYKLDKAKKAMAPHYSLRCCWRRPHSFLRIQSVETMESRRCRRA